MQPLTQDEVNMLPEETRVSIQWAKTDEVFEYTILRNKWGVVCYFYESISSVVTEQNIKHRQPLKNVGSTPDKNKVYLIK